MKTIVVYNSQTGFTEKYAQWIAESASADCLPLSAAKKQDMDTYEAIIFGGWACAGRISKLDWFTNHIDKWQGKKLIAFCVGGSPIDNPEIGPFLRKNFSDSQWGRVHVFYCPGGFNYDKMAVPSKLMMKMFVKSLEAKKDKTEAEQEMVKMISASYDISDRKYIEPILKCLDNQ